MCVIIVRQPGIEIDPAKLTSACRVNPHGYGISVVDRGKIETFKNFRTQGNDPKEVIKIFEDAKDQLVFAHLRYNTKGLSNLGNCHPFQIFKEGDFETFFMHNGTIGGMGDNNRSDSREFAEEILSPLTRAFREIEGDSILNHKTYRAIIEKYRPSSSLFTLYTSNGDHFTLGKGVDHEGWWSSNEYSFNDNHRASDNSSYSSNFGYWDNWNNHSMQSNSLNDVLNRRYENHTAWRVNDYYHSTRKEWGRWTQSQWDINETLTKIDQRCTFKVTAKPKKDETVVPFVANANVPESKSTDTNENTSNGDFRNEVEALAEDCAAIGQAIHAAKNANLSPSEHVSPAKRVTFSELADITTLDDVTMLDEEQLYEIAERWPLAMTMLCMDLIYELYSKRSKERLEKAHQTLVEAYGENKKEPKKAVN